jgi:hypothetical protein
VYDQHCLAVRKLNYKALVSRPVAVVRQHPSHDAAAFDPYIACFSSRA